MKSNQVAGFDMGCGGLNAIRKYKKKMSYSMLQQEAEGSGTEEAVCLDMQKPLTLHDHNKFLLKSSQS